MKIIVIAVTALLIGMAAIFTYSGLFTSVSITEKEMGPYTLVYIEHKGSYTKSIAIQRTVLVTLRKEFSITTRAGFGIYYDNPKKVKTMDLRSEIGSIIQKPDQSKIDLIKKKFKIKEFPATKCVVAEFPLRNVISIILGIIKVYPELEKYNIQKKYKQSFSMEIYDRTENKMLFIMPIVTK